jgi:hypothetical protein
MVSSSPFDLLSPFSQSIGRFLYDPTTNWQGAFSPSFIFNQNPQDVPIEGHVLAEVGSYGKQIGILIRAIDALSAAIDETKLTAAQKDDLASFHSLAKQTTAAASDYRRKMSSSEVLDFVKAYAENHSPTVNRQLLAGIASVLDAKP